MVLINDKKYACGTCIKGHRVSGCTHTDRPLFEVKKKGRPTTQCVHCRDKRKIAGAGANGGTVHAKCACGEPKPVNVLMPGTTTPVPSNEPYPSQTREGSPPADLESFETRKGMPGSNPTFPNGLKDVHDMAAAAEALSGLGTESETIKVAERKVASLLNPCHCTTGGPCKCCQPRRERADSLRASSPSSSGTRTPTNGHGNVTDSLIEMFKAKATTSSTPPEQQHPQLSINTNSSGPNWAQTISSRDSYLSPSNMHHPAHTSPHVHKTKLYSPYSMSGHSTPRHGRKDTASPAISRPGGWGNSSVISPPARLRPLADMNKFLGAVFREDGSVNEEIPRSALGLPGIKTFDTMAENGGVKIEPMEMDLDGPIQFPTHEDVVIGACTCGENCECAGCATHGNPPNPGEEGHVHHSGCGDSCKSSFDCGDHLSLPSGITSIGHLLSIAAANVPHPVRLRPGDLNAHAHDTRILPPAVHVSEDAARSMGMITLKPLECCNGRCQCAPGQCTCEKDCCGCCIRCSCDEDGDQKMNEEPSKGCCSTETQTQSQTQSRPQSQPQPPAVVQGSCCSTDNASSAQSSPRKSATPPHLSPQPVYPVRTGRLSPLLSPDSAANTPPRQPSPRPPVAASSLRRASSTSQPHASTSGISSAPIHRRATMTHGNNAQRSASTGKQASKSLALHTTPHHPHAHPHPRPILPKPPSGQQLGLPKTSNNSAGTSRVATPIHPAASAANSTQHSPALPPQTNLSSQSQPQTALQLPDASIAVPTLPKMPDFAQNGQSSSGSNPPNDNQNSLSDMGFPDLAMDNDLMAFINSLSAQVDPGLSYQVASSESSLEQPLATPDFTYDQNQPFDHQAALSQGFDPDFLAMLNNAVESSQSSQSQAQPQPQSQSGPMTLSMSQAETRQMSQPQASSSNTPSQRVARINAFSDDSQPGFPQNVVDLFIASNNQNPDVEPAPIYQQLPPQSTAFLQQMFAENPIFTHPSVPNYSHPSSDPSKASPNMIDLSKPLNSSDVERILRALQDQQARQTSSPTSSQSHSQQPHVNPTVHVASVPPPNNSQHNQQSQHSQQGLGHQLQQPNNMFEGMNHGQHPAELIAPSQIPGTAYIGDGVDYTLGFVGLDQAPLNPLNAHTGESNDQANPSGNSGGSSLGYPPNVSFFDENSIRPSHEQGRLFVHCQKDFMGM